MNLDCLASKVRQAEDKIRLAGQAAKKQVDLVLLVDQQFGALGVRP